MGVDYTAYHFYGAFLPEDSKTWGAKEDFEQERLEELDLPNGVSYISCGTVYKENGLKFAICASEPFTEVWNFNQPFEETKISELDPEIDDKIREVLQKLGLPTNIKIGWYLGLDER